MQRRTPENDIKQQTRFNRGSVALNTTWNQKLCARAGNSEQTCEIEVDKGLIRFQPLAAAIQEP